MNNNKKASGSIFSSLGWSYAERLSAQAVSLIVSVILARLLVPEDYGIISIVTVFITIGDALVNGGFGNALVQKKDATELDFNSIGWVSLGVSAVIYAVLFALAPYIAILYKTPVLTSVIRVMSIKFIFSAINSVQCAYLQKKLMFRKLFFSNFIGAIISAVAGIGMALSGFGVWALIVQYLTNAVVGTLILHLTVGWRLRFQFSWTSVKQLWSFGAKVLGATLVFNIRDNIRTLIVGKRFSTEDLAFYNQGQRFPSLLVADIVDSMGRVIYPALANKQDDKDGIKALMRRAITLSAYLLTPMLAGLLMVSEPFVKVILTDKWLPCVPYLQIMCVAYVTRSVSAIFQKGLLAIGKSTLNLVHEILTSSITVISLLVAVFVFNSVELIAWSYVGVAFIGMAFYAVFVSKYIGYTGREMLADYFPTIALSAAMSLSVYAVSLIDLSVFWIFVLQIAVGASVYLILSWVFKVEQLTFIISFIKSKIRKSDTKADKSIS